MLYGIDISNYQRNNYKYLIDTYAKDFVICRAAWRYKVDPMCDPMYQYAKNKGKKLGVYFFPLTSDGSPEEHAEWAYNQVLGYINEAIPILDWEAYSGAEGKNDVAFVDWAYRWLNRFYNLSGVKPMIYMNSNCNSLYNFEKFVKANFGLWIANYGKNLGGFITRPKVKWWISAAMHQYTSLGDNGKNLDKDAFYGDREAWAKFAKSNKEININPSPIEKYYTEAEVQEIIKSTENKYFAEIDRLTKEARDSQSKLGICEKVVKAAKEGVEGLLNYNE